MGIGRISRWTRLDLLVVAGDIDCSANMKAFARIESVVTGHTIGVIFTSSGFLVFVEASIFFAVSRYIASWQSASLLSLLLQARLRCEPLG
jgi:hypothetical protein